MLNRTNPNKCKICGNKARYTHYDIYYCKNHYLTEIFKCEDVHTFVKMNKIFHLHSAIDNHIYIRNRNKDVIELCHLLGVDYWFSKGHLGMIDMSNCMHIGKELSKEDTNEC